MAANYNETVPLGPEEIDFGEEQKPSKKDNKIIWIIVAVVAAVLLCCCLIGILGIAWLWNNGDQFIEGWTALSPFVNIFLS